MVRRYVLFLIIKGFQILMNYLLQASRYDLHNADVQRCNVLLDKYIVAYQKLSSNSW